MIVTKQQAEKLAVTWSAFNVSVFNRDPSTSYLMGNLLWVLQHELDIWLIEQSRLQELFDICEGKLGPELVAAARRQRSDAVAKFKKASN